jgi:TPR repeat protein
MAKTVQNEKKDRSRPRQRAATRSAILSAARRLVERSGSESLTLSAVGREASLAPTTVFAHFANKSELFLAIVVDDVTQFARSMSEQEKNEIAAKDSGVAPELVETGDSPAPRLRLVARKRSTNEIGKEPPKNAAEISPPSDLARETDITNQAMDQGLAKLQETVARLEARPVDAWLERRLREFERGLAAIEAKQAGVDHTAAQLALEESIRSLGARLEGLEGRLSHLADETLCRISERLDTSQDRARQVHSDNDAAHARITSRLDALENAVYAATAGVFQHRPHEETQAPQAGAVAEFIAPPAKQDVAPDSEAPPVSASGFLSAARRSALKAQLRAETEKPLRKSPHRLRRRTLYWIVGGLSVLVGLIWTRVYVTAREIEALPAITINSPAHAAIVPSRQLMQAVGPVQAGSAKADLMIGLSLLAGPGRNDAAAAKWLSLAAEQGNAMAAWKLAGLYRNGLGVPANAARAFHWNEVAANARNCDAMYNLAVAYAEGWGTAKDYSAAARWFAQAAALGMTDSQFNLGVMYERGLGVPSNLADAYRWYLIAAAQGDSQAALRVAALKPELASSDLMAAEEAAAAFKPVPRDHDANDVPQAPHSAS